MNRIWIRGTSGSGKTTLAYDLEKRLGIPATDLDDLNWLPGWTERPVEEFRALVAEVAAKPQWAISGNYGKANEFIVPIADTVVWLDYSFPVVFGRLLKRTFRRVVRGEQCCNGNREDVVKTLFDRESILWWCITTHRKRHLQCLEYMAETPPPGQTRLRHRTPKETQDWLRSLPSSLPRERSAD
ncbi:adenylate kinase [bacterium]|nr:MAG: adenylate kinase [bacterium]